MNKKNLIELLLIFFISLFVIFYQFNRVPKKLSFDEVEFARLALSLDKKPYLVYSQLATGHSTLYFYLLLASLKTFGINNFGLRFPSALFGLVDVLIFYLIGQMIFEKTRYFKQSFLDKKTPYKGIKLRQLLPFFLTLIFIFTRWHFSFARFSFEVTFLLFLELLGIYFFLRFRQAGDKKIIFLIISAIFAGLAFHSYYPGRIFFLLPLMFLFFSVKRELMLRNVSIFLSVFLIVASPLIFYLLYHQDMRIQEQFFLTDKRLNLSTKIAYFGENSLKIIGMFNLLGDLNGRHNYPGKPVLNPVLGAFFLLGFSITILNLKNFYNQFFLIYFFLSLIPAIFTYPVENPNALRTFTASVSVLYFIGNGLVYFLESESKNKLLFSTALLFVVIFFLLSAFYDFRTYYRYQSQVFKRAFEINGNLNKILKLRLWEKTKEI